MRHFVAVAALALLAACTPAPAEFASTTETDAAWASVSACYEAAGYNSKVAREPDVIVRDDCRSERASQEFVGSEGSWVFGEAHPLSGYVEVCPDMAALEHEFSHVMHRAVLFDNGLHGTGCFGVVL